MILTPESVLLYESMAYGASGAPGENLNSRIFLGLCKDPMIAQEFKVFLFFGFIESGQSCLNGIS
jgi:hypothetical protein